MTVARAIDRVSTLVALGSSTTQGAGASDPATRGYVALLAKALESRVPDLETVNLARPGGRMRDFLDGWADVESSRPSMLVVLPFSDFASTPIERFEEDGGRLVASIDRLAQASLGRGEVFRAFFGDLRIDPEYVGRGPADSGKPGYRPADYAMLTEKNATVARLANEVSSITVVPVIDQNAIHPEWIGPNGHPNDLGHGYIAGCFRTPVEDWLTSLDG